VEFGLDHQDNALSCDEFVQRKRARDWLLRRLSLAEKTVSEEKSRLQVRQMRSAEGVAKAQIAEER
jgi:hypothetical protein